MIGGIINSPARRSVASVVVLGVFAMALIVNLVSSFEGRRQIPAEDVLPPVRVPGPDLVVLGSNALLAPYASYGTWVDVPITTKNIGTEDADSSVTQAKFDAAVEIVGESVWDMTVSFLPAGASDTHMVSMQCPPFRQDGTEWGNTSMFLNVMRTSRCSG